MQRTAGPPRSVIGMEHAMTTDKSTENSSKKVRQRIEQPLIDSARFLTLFAVVGSLAASLLMFLLGVKKVVDAYLFWLPTGVSRDEGIARDASAIIGVIEALDRFLIAIVLLYFAYGVFSLFLRRRDREEDAKLTSRLEVQSIGQLKQVVAEVILVVLFVLFLRVALEIYGSPGLKLSWSQIATIIVLPVSTAFLALSLRLAELHPKPGRGQRPGSEDRWP